MTSRSTDDVGRDTGSSAPEDYADLAQRVAAYLSAYSLDTAVRARHHEHLRALAAARRHRCPPATEEAPNSANGEQHARPDAHEARKTLEAGHSMTAASDIMNTLPRQVERSVHARAGDA